MISLINTHPILKVADGLVNSLPSPVNISSFWNFGFLLRMGLIVQIITGIFLAIHYTSDLSTAFLSVDHILRDVNNGWIIRILHSNGASFFFFCLFIHVGRGIYYESFFMVRTWRVGVLIFFARIAVAFLGYVLPWGQISFWGATVITNLFSVIPFVGDRIITWLWGGFSVNSPTLTRFFCFHFFLPFILVVLIGLHLIFLHQTGSRNPLGVNRDFFKVTFHPYYISKDILGGILILVFLEVFIFYYPWVLADPENFIPANSLVTPVHIQPEWYFLFAYAILRSIPRKTGGVIALLFSLLVLFFMPLIRVKVIKGGQFNIFSKLYFWFLVSVVLVLTWIGARPVDGVYILIGQVATFFYFTYFIFFSYAGSLWEDILKLYWR